MTKKLFPLHNRQKFHHDYFLFQSQDLILTMLLFLLSNETQKNAEDTNKRVNT